MDNHSHDNDVNNLRLTQVTAEWYNTCLSEYWTPQAFIIHNASVSFKFVFDGGRYIGPLSNMTIGITSKK